MEVGITITTDDDKIREIFEPNAPSIETRIHALKEFSQDGIEKDLSAWAMLWE